MALPDSRERTASALLLALALLLEAGLVALAALLYRVPATLHNIYGYSPLTRPFFAAGWGLAAPATVDEATFRGWFSALWLMLNAAWLVAFLLARRMGVRPVLLLVPGLLFQFTLVLAMPPVLSTDLYNYLAYGRMVVFHGLNPYTASPSQMAGDPVLAFQLLDIVSHYGPLWLGLSSAIAWLSGWSGLFAGLILFKGLAGLSHLAIAWLGYSLMRGGGGSPAQAAASAVLLGSSPLLLLEGAGGGHNDLLMMALALAGLLAYQRRRPWLGYLLVLLSAMVKYVTLLLLIFYLLAWLREQEGTRARLRLIGTAVAAGLLVLLLAYAPFWSGWATAFAGIAEETTHVMLSPAAFLRQPLVGGLLALGVPVEQARSVAPAIINGIQKGALLLLVLWYARRIWLRRQELLPEVTAAWGITALVYLCLLHNAIFPWYFAWPFATTGAEWYRPAQRWVARFSGVFGVLSVLFYALSL